MTSDLELVSTDDLLKEVFSRFALDCVFIANIPSSKTSLPGDVSYLIHYDTSAEDPHYATIRDPGERLLLFLKDLGKSLKTEIQRGGLVDGEDSGA